MNRLRKIIRKYDWDFIGVWSSILTVCIGTLFCIGMLVVMGCDRVSAKQSESKQIMVAAKTFTLPEIPAILISSDKRAEHLVLHYWENLNYSDTAAWTTDADLLEQAFVDYIVLFQHTTEQVVEQAIGNTIQKANTDQLVYDWFAEMFDKYLYDVNSPFRDEECYAMVLEQILSNPNVDEVYKIRPVAQLKQINQNRQGTVAEDFTYALANGKKGTLHKIKADYTLLFFYDPDCPDCKRTKEVLKTSPEVAGLISSEKLAVLALYPDEDIEIWKTYRSTMPPAWTNACDASPGYDIKNKLYTIRAIPSLYLLDKDKRVVLKDAVVEQILAELASES